MSIVAHTTTPAANPEHPRLWKPRLYPGDLAQTSRVREDLRADLAGAARPIGDDLTDTLILCLSEMFANAVDHSRSGQAGGQVVRTLTWTATGRLRLQVIDDGTRTSPDAAPVIPDTRTADEWCEAEHGRGLLLIAGLATAWGTRMIHDLSVLPPVGTLIWADFSMSDAAPAPEAGQ